MAVDTDSMMSFQEELSQMDQEKTLFQGKLAVFPHSFQLENQDSVGPNQLERLKAGLESALDVGYKTDLETARARNLLAYFLHRLQQNEDALHQLDQVQAMAGQQDNLVTLANKAVILWHQHRLSDADEAVDALQQIQQQDDFAYLVVKAKAELAFSYTRLGPRFGPNAIALFREVIPQARLPEKWLWKFGLGLTRRRLLRAALPSVAASPSSEMMEEQRDLLDLFVEITNNCPCDNLKAKTYSEMARLLNSVWRGPTRGEFIRRAGVNLEKACERALELDGNDNSVLCKCGLLFRYIRKLDESCELLEKALSIRPSSTSYHHLGLTYKSMATREKYQQTGQTPPRVWHPMKANPTGKPSTCYSDLTKQMGRMSLETSTPSRRGGRHGNNPRNAPTTTEKRRVDRPRNYSHSAGGLSAIGRQDLEMARNYTGMSGTAKSAYNATPSSNLSKDHDIRRMQKMVKSPPQGVTCFTMDDKYVKEALRNFELAVEFSRGENTRALYDLALFQKVLKQLNRAKENLQKMLRHEKRMYITDYINAYEQMGLITKEMTEAETDETNKKKLLKDSNRMLLQALKVAAKYFSKSKMMRDSIPQVWSSFPVLMQFVEDSEQNPHEKLQEKAKLLQLIDEHKGSLDLLLKIKEMDPSRVEDPEYLKLNIEAYVSDRQYEEALVFISLLECTQQAMDTLQLFQDKNYVSRVTLQATRNALLQGSPIAMSHIQAVFKETVLLHSDEPTSSEDTDSCSSEREDETRDLTILHEESAADDAFALANVFEEVCGLTVYVQDRDAPVNRLDLECVLRLMRRGSLLVVLAGHKPVSHELRYFINNAAKRPSTVTLLLDGGRHVPEMLKAHRSMACPPEVLRMLEPSPQQPLPRSLSQDEGHRSKVNALVKVLSFLVGVDVDITDTA